MCSISRKSLVFPQVTSEELDLAKEARNITMPSVKLSLTDVQKQKCECFFYQSSFYGPVTICDETNSAGTLLVLPKCPILNILVFFV